MNVRRAMAADAASIAGLHVSIWQETYRDLAPPEARAALNLSFRLPRWEARLARDAADELVLLAEADGIPAGFGHCGPADEAVFEGRGEIHLLYVDGRYGRRGIGRRLMGEMAGFLEARGHRGIGLGVVAGNVPAIAFYQGLGGRIAATYTDPGPLWRSQNHLMVWDDLPALIAVSRAWPAGRGRAPGSVRRGPDHER